MLSNNKGFGSMIGLLLTMAIIAVLFYFFFEYYYDGLIQPASPQAQQLQSYGVSPSSPQAAVGSARQRAAEVEQLMQQRAGQINKMMQGY